MNEGFIGMVMGVGFFESGLRAQEMLKTRGVASGHCQGV